MLRPTLQLGRSAALSTVSLLLYLHLFLAPFRCSYYLCVHCLSSLSAFVFLDIHSSHSFWFFGAEIVGSSQNTHTISFPEQHESRRASHIPITDHFTVCPTWSTSNWAYSIIRYEASIYQSFPAFNRTLNRWKLRF